MLLSDFLYVILMSNNKRISVLPYAFLQLNGHQSKLLCFSPVNEYESSENDKRYCHIGEVQEYIWRKKDTGQMHKRCKVHAGTYGQQAGGMHPTGMQSCLRDVLH